MIQEISWGVGLFGGLILSLEAGFRIGRRVKVEGGLSGQIGVVQGALLGLLGLLLGFSFAGAAGRFMERQDLITREANAIGTAYLRADLLDDPFRSELRSALKQYTHDRIAEAPRLRGGVPEDLQRRVEADHARIWSAARDGVLAKPHATVAVLPPVNEVIDLHTSRVAAGRKHLPGLILSLLIVCAALAVASIGYASGLAGRRLSAVTISLAFLIAAALWSTIDLDHPRAGLMQLNDAALKSLRFD